MNWKNHDSYIELYPPKEFDFEQCLDFLARDAQEMLHKIKDGNLIKLLKIDEEMILCKIEAEHKAIKVEFLSGKPSYEGREEIAKYIWEWFDLDQNLEEFYSIASEDKILSPLVKRYYGLRIVGMPDLFESLVWAIIGQQINLNFAYTLKKRFVQDFGENIVFENETYWVFPSYDKIAQIEVEELRNHQFTTRKAEYIIGIAKAMTTNEISKEALLNQHDFEKIKQSLMALRGVGAWSADYVLMKCFHDNSSYPVGDVGLQNAFKSNLGLDRKPTAEEMYEYAKAWKGWEAYATFYLWRSLSDKTT